MPRTLALPRNQYALMLALIALVAIAVVLYLRMGVPVHHVLGSAKTSFRVNWS